LMKHRVLLDNARVLNIAVLHKRGCKAIKVMAHPLLLIVAPLFTASNAYST